MRIISVIILVFCISTLGYSQSVRSTDSIKAINGIAFGEKLSDEFRLDPEYVEGEDLHPYSRVNDTKLYGVDVADVWYLATPTKKMFGVESTFKSLKAFNSLYTYLESAFGSAVEFGYVDGKVIFVWSSKDTYIELGWNDSMSESGEGWIVIKKDFIFENEVYTGK